MTVTTGTENGGENGGRTGVPKVHVIGWPIEHSRSPLIHGHWLQHYNLPGTYTKKAVAPDEFERFIRSFGAAGIAGANVTVPFKEQAFQLADHTDAAARAIEAANTLWLQDGELHASNTDGYGFLANLDAGAPGWNAGERPVAVLGAGGAARGVLQALLSRGITSIRLTNRTRQRAEVLADYFGAALSVTDWEMRNEELADCGLVINTTSLGMEGCPPLDVDLSRLPDNAVVTDLVYAPLKTELLKAAAARGHVIVDGLGMLLHQAVPGFEKWFGVRPEVTPELRALVVSDLEAPAC